MNLILWKDTRLLLAVSAYRDVGLVRNVYQELQYMIVNLIFLCKFKNILMKPQNNLQIFGSGNEIHLSDLEKVIFEV
jgi:hypothetical protein